MTWEAVAAEMKALLEQIPKGVPPDAGESDTPRAWQQLLQLRRDEIDSLCECQAQSGRWPELTPEQQWLLSLRLLWGWKLALLLCVPVPGLGTPPLPLPPPPAALPGMIRLWLLVDTWRLGGEALAAAQAGAAALLPPEADPLPPDVPPFRWN